MADEAAMGFELVVGKFCADQTAGLVFRIIECDVGEDAGEGGGEFRERFVLFGSEIVLQQFATLDFALDWFGSNRTSDKIFGANATRLMRSGDLDVSAIFVVLLVPAIQWIGVGIGADVGDFDADGARIGD